MVTDLGKKAELLTVQDVKEILLGNAAKKGDYGNGNPENHRRKAYGTIFSKNVASSKKWLTGQVPAGNANRKCNFC